MGIRMHRHISGAEISCYRRKVAIKYRYYDKGIQRSQEGADEEEPRVRKRAEWIPMPIR